MGGVQFPHLTKIAKELWQWSETRNIMIFASYNTSADNSVADAESQRVHPDIEWSYAFQKIVHHFGYPEVDIFASRSNCKCSVVTSDSD
ncbi:unnamed protein product [Pieris brassicae]|uniref:Uncharacterized protein n=1 Tax=Pieris brassicae TaxID=7116 RepID=A0A9P0SWE4_PIEBR|nr:unnamed protein product [Pieris brassicae]